MGERLLICCQHVTAIITGSGSIHKILIGSRMQMMEERVSQSTAEKRGRPKITSRLRSFTTFPWTTLFLITFTARNRTTRALVLPVAQIGARLDPRIGSQSAVAS